MANLVALAVISIVSSYLAAKLLKEKLETPLRDDKPTTRITVGTYSPLLIGKRRIGPYIAWFGDWNQLGLESVLGGKGFDSGGNDNETVWFCNAVHVLPVGPGSQLHAVLINGAKVWLKSVVGALTPATAPSGTTIETQLRNENQGSFVIYWGEDDQGLDAWSAATTRLGVLSKWPFGFRILWKNFRCGGFKVWPTVEYVVEVRPYNTTLTQSASWLVGSGPGGVFHNIMDVGHPIQAPFFKVAGDQTLTYTEKNLLQVTGQSAALNKLYVIESVVYDVADTHYEVTDAYVDTVTDTKLPTAWNKDVNVTVIASTSEDYPLAFDSANGNIYVVKETDTEFTTKKIWYQTPIIPQFSLGGQKLKLFFKLVASVGEDNWCKIGFADTTGLTKTASVKFTKDFITGAVSFSEITNLIQIDLFLVLSDGWVEIELTYNSGDGPNPLEPADNRLVYMEFDSFGLQNNEIHLFIREATQSFLQQDPGNLFTGLTTINVDDNLEGVLEDVGQLEAYVDGAAFAPEGANPAHALEQLMFETYPHGAGLDKTYFDMNSLEDFGQTATVEGMRTHILLEDGDTFQAGVGLILQDTHAYISWNYLKEKYEIGTIRDTVADTLANIPADLIVKKPEITQNHERRTPNLVVFTYRNVDLLDREDTVPLDDDAIAGIFNNRITEKAAIETAGDFFYAEQAAERKQLEMIWPASAFKITGNRDVKMLHPGRAVTADGFNEVLRITETNYDFDTGKSVLTCLSDIFTTASAEQQPMNTPNWDDGDPPEITSADDLDLQMWELPPMLAGRRVSIFPLRIRANAVSTNATLLTSVDDVTYKRVGTSVPYISGGTLVEDLTDIGTIVTTGPAFTALGPDILNISQTLSDTDWYSGRQFLIMGSEVMYLKQITALGGGNYRLDGIQRARLGTTRGSFDAGAKLYILPASKLKRFTDIMFSPGSILYIKTVPIGTDVATATSYNRTLVGMGIKPSTPVSVRTSDNTSTYQSGDDITVVWDYIHPDGAERRFGAGFQEAGEPLEEAVEVLGYFRLTWYDGSTTLRTVDLLEAVTYTYTNANLISDLGTSAEPDLDLDIEHIVDGYKSTAAQITITIES